jgi:hypothetical protein
MIDASMIPDEVVEAARRAYYAEKPCGFRESIAAALAAWPDGCVGESKCGWYRYIELPLPEGAADD